MLDLSVRFLPLTVVGLPVLFMTLLGCIVEACQKGPSGKVLRDAARGGPANG